MTSIESTLAGLTTAIVRLGQSVQLLARSEGTRITRAELAQRLGVHRNTISRLTASKDFPKPCNGKWLLSEIIEWELSKTLGNVGGTGVVVDGGKLGVAPSEHPAQIQQVQPLR